MASNVQHCNCNWDDCDDIFDDIKKHMPSNHLWNGSCIRIEFGSNEYDKLSLKKYVFYYSVLKHCVLNNTIGSNIGNANLFLRRHHFPFALLDFRQTCVIKQYFSFLTRDLVKKICVLDGGRFRFHKRSNTVLSLSKGIASNKLKKDSKDLNTLYVQLPMSTRKEVIEDIQHYMKKHSRKRQIKAIATVINKQKKKKKVTKSVLKKKPERQSLRIIVRDNDKIKMSIPLKIDNLLSPRAQRSLTQSFVFSASIAPIKNDVPITKKQSVKPPIGVSPIMVVSPKKTLITSTEINLLLSPELITSLVQTNAILIKIYESYIEKKMTLFKRILQ